MANSVMVKVFVYPRHSSLTLEELYLQIHVTLKTCYNTPDNSLIADTVRVKRVSRISVNGHKVRDSGEIPCIVQYIQCGATLYEIQRTAATWPLSTNTTSHAPHAGNNATHDVQ